VCRAAEKLRDGGGRGFTSWAHELDRDTVAISHGAATRILRGLFLGLDWKAMSDLDERQDCVFRYRDGELKTDWNMKAPSRPRFDALPLVP
jgi:broad specificity phosphatase PhoE